VIQGLIPSGGVYTPAGHRKANHLYPAAEIIY